MSPLLVGPFDKVICDQTGGYDFVLKFNFKDGEKAHEERLEGDGYILSVNPLSEIVYDPTGNIGEAQTYCSYEVFAYSGVGNIAKRLG